ncbi:hypothetical protein [uncultured Maribacter sp.]|uniref:hypothetical protein n=1 Tax=uncultured Maribacter sp. TaxID=431308 RepID=UPI0026050B43|nr:hypothetical protein [uncultured Maribacter sp.]
MRILLFIITLLLTVGASFGQQPVINSVTLEICNALSNSKKSPEELSYEDSRNIIKNAISINSSDWISEINNFKKKTGQPELAYYEYFLHILRIDCPNFRRIEDKFEKKSYTNDKSKLLHLKAKEFVIGLQDNLKNIDLKKLVSNNIEKNNIENLLNLSKVEINKCKRTSTFYIMLIHTNGYTYRVTYIDYLTTESEFQIDIIFNDDTDLLIDNLIIKSKNQLMKELKERIDFNKKVKSGKINIPPPPPNINK